MYRCMAERGCIMKKMLFIYNPNAGTGILKPKLSEVLDIFTKGGYEVTVYPTQRTHDAVEKIQSYEGSYDLLVTLEGRTLKEVSRFVSEKLSPIDEVISTATHFILKKYKDHGTIMVPKKESERMLVTP